MTQDLWHFSRRQLTKQVLDTFNLGLTHALTLFSPRRTGKTEWLLKDLAPAAVERGIRVAYASFWQAQGSPVIALLAALEEAGGPRSWNERLKSWAKAPIGKIALSSELAGMGKAEAELKLDEVKARAADKADLLQLDALLSALAKRDKKLLLLLIDEVQYLASDKAYQPLVAALRTSLDKYRDKVKVVFTGSSRTGLVRMFSEETAPFFHFGQQIDFPPLERDFVEHILNVYSKVTQRKLDADKAWRAFEKLGRSPLHFRSLIERLILTASTDINRALREVQENISEKNNYIGKWNEQKAIDRELLRAIASEQRGLHGKELRNEIGKKFGIPTPEPIAIQNALNRLLEQGIIVRTGKPGTYDFEDTQFKSWLIQEKEASDLI